MSDSSMDHHLFLILVLAFPVVHCPITSVINANGDTEVDLSSITSHITHLEKQVSSLQHQFESDLKSTMTDLVSVRSELKASREEHDQLREDLNAKCQILKLASDELNVTRSEISRLKEESREVKTACVANVHSLTNVLEIVGAITTNISFEVSLSHPQHSVGDKDTLKFDKVRVNSGHHYHKDTGAFTAPVSGSYMLWASIRLTEPNSFINIYVHSHNKVIGHGHAETSTSTPSVATLLTVTFLRVDDKVWFTKHSGSTVIHGDIHASVTSIYGGALLRPH
ncbi:heavy metal-binding protein HIP-like [Haliotis cracherodii]|uniref:heavy metal-binding protein HIP-like n=1 Tax=Haliotis cracherodii TaxID=6455 RepID=UPI0039EA5B63